MRSKYALRSSIIKPFCLRCSGRSSRHRHRLFHSCRIGLPADRGLALPTSTTESIMNTSTTVWIIVAAVAAILVIIALVIAARRASGRRRQREAEGIREDAKLETGKVERREALAAETAAKARAAQAEAEVKAAEAARLQDRAAAHQTEAASSREQLDEQWKRADSMPPRVKGETGGSADEPASGRDGAWSQEQPIPDNSPTEDMSAHHRET